MYKTPLVVLALSAAMSTSAFSSGFLQKMLPASKSPDANMMVSKTEQTRTGTDFSGTWVGTCNGEDQGIKNVLTIKNTDYGIEIDGQYYDMNSMVSEGSSHARWYENSQFRITWNENKDKLMVHGISINTHQNGNHSFRSEMFELTFFLKDDQLVTKGKIQSYKNSKFIRKFPYNCTYKRQA